MAGPQLQTTAIVLGRQPSGADAFEQLSVFSEQEGLLLCLRRQSSKGPTGQSAPLDLFDETELWLESPSEGRTWFIKEHRHLTRHPGIGRSYEALQTAAALTRLVQRNPVPDESRGPVAALLREALQSLDRGARPDLVWFKALFRLLRDEGYPVKQHWWQQLESADRAAAAAILNRPITGQECEPLVVQRLTRHLVGWVRSDTELHVD